MEVDGNSKKLMEVVQSTPETDPVPSPSRKRKGNGLSGDGATLKELSADSALLPELSKWEEEGVRAVEQIIRRQKAELDVNSSEGKQVLHSMINSLNSLKEKVLAMMDALEFNCEEKKFGVAQFVESNRRTKVGLSDSMAEPNTKKVDMSSNVLPVDGGSESCSLADDDDDKVGAMEFDTSAMEEQASGIGHGGTLEMEEERLSPVATDDVDKEEEQVGLGLAMFDTHADLTPTTKSAAELDEMDKGKSSEQLAEEATEMAMEEEDFTDHTSNWESNFGSKGCGSFPDTTTLSSMQLAHLIHGSGPSDLGEVCTTLQVYSIKLSGIKGGLQWPLHVYGIVAVRDSVDHNRNILFARASTKCQIVTEDDPYLCLIGPSRAIVFKNAAVFEIQLKLGASQISRDRSLISGTRRYYVGYGTISFENCFCTTELRVQPIQCSVQATILDVHVKEGTWPSSYGGIVYCYAPPRGEAEQEDQKLVLYDSQGWRMNMGLGGHLNLSRHVVSVQAESCLKFILQSYSSPSCDMGESTTVCFRQRFSSTSQKTCYLGGKEVEITVGWSRLVVEKQNITIKGLSWMGRDERHGGCKMGGMKPLANTN